ncbi:PREDICTED: lysosome-associated membrane glycoprotein 3 [Propithecus coquereli]|uniref:Lysosome-associated membrane glycoprotein 3 n=1 Tax=Propithecus coquereli TaxID=379532 RepID=A0A2K6ENK3_PROCO|nr:PREDICTED: lysosome-associated membrane glycoprotein 3 [Propithecus coquereli]
MSRQLSAVVALFMSLAVILQDGSQARAKSSPESRVYLQPTTAATAKPSLLQQTNQVPHETLAARSTDGHITSEIAATVKTPTTPVTTRNTPPTSPIMHTLITTQATANSHTATPVTEATIGNSSAPHSQPPTSTPPAYTTGTSPSTVCCTTGQTTHPSNPTTLPMTLSTAPHKSTTSQKLIQSSYAPGTTTAAHNTTQTTSPASTAPGPTLAPQPSSAKTGTYQVLNGSRLCIKAEMGIQLIVQDKESVFPSQRYFNIEPNATQASGNCGSQKSNLLLNFRGGFVNLTFTKDEKSYYISKVGAYLTVSNPETIYQGLKGALVLFETVVGHSFRCVSEQSLQLSAQLQLKTMNVQLQAFDLEDDHFGNVDECSSDYTIMLPVIGAIVVGLFLVGMGVYKIRVRCQSSGYQRI